MPGIPQRLSFALSYTFVGPAVAHPAASEELKRQPERPVGAQRADGVVLDRPAGTHRAAARTGAQRPHCARLGRRVLELVSMARCKRRCADND